MKFYEHPAYIGFANDPDLADDKRQKQWKKEFKQQGFDETCTWSLDACIIQFITPRLSHLYDIHKESIDAPDLLDDIETILVGFNLFLSEDFNEFNKKHVKKVDKAFKLLAKNYKGLWW